MLQEVVNYKLPRNRYESFTNTVHRLQDHVLHLSASADTLHLVLAGLKSLKERLCSLRSVDVILQNLLDNLTLNNFDKSPRCWPTETIFDRRLTRKLSLFQGSKWFSIVTIRTCQSQAYFQNSSLLNRPKQAIVPSKFSGSFYRQFIYCWYRSATVLNGTLTASSLPVFDTKITSSIISWKFTKYIKRGYNIYTQAYTLVITVMHTYICVWVREMYF